MSDQYQLQDVLDSASTNNNINNEQSNNVNSSIGIGGITEEGISMMIDSIGLNNGAASSSAIPVSSIPIASGSGSNSGPWYPPIPSLASLPVDKSKTDPKPAYYKLQFGDEVTGFSYYVRTLAVMIGRNCDRNGAVLPPPSITAPSVPINPPLDPNQPSPPIQPFSEPIISSFGLHPDEIFNHTSPPKIEFPTPPIQPHTSFSVPPQSPPHPSSAPLSTEFLNDGFSIPPRAQSEGMIDHSIPPDLSFLQDEDYPDIDMGEFGVLEELAEAVKTEQNLTSQASLSVEPESMSSHSQSQPPILTPNQEEISVKLEKMEDHELPAPVNTETGGSYVNSLEPAQSLEVQNNSAMEIDNAQIPHNGFSLNGVDMDMGQIKFEDIEEVPLPPPPPPPGKSSGPTKHVDVDLGPLKSVSRNHAKIEYRADLGHFCLEIFGRNGAWVDDRYFVKGSVVPLNQGSQIQIATRIFSFVLPPSPVSSPTYTHYALDGVGAEAMEDLPYPYNLPPSEVGYQEFYGEPGPGPSSAASLAARAPPTFNAFAAADGYGLGIEGVGESSWAGWNSDDDDDDDDDSDEEELDESGEEWEEDVPLSQQQKVVQEIQPDLSLFIPPVTVPSKEKDKSKSKPKLKSKSSKTGTIPGEDDSELSSVASEHEPEEEKNKKVKKQSEVSTSTSVTKTKPIAPAPAPAPTPATAVASATAPDTAPAPTPLATPVPETLATSTSIPTPVPPDNPSINPEPATDGVSPTSTPSEPTVVRKSYTIDGKIVYVNGVVLGPSTPKKPAKKKEKVKETKDKDEINDKDKEACDGEGEEKTKEKNKEKKEKNKEAGIDKDKKQEEGEEELDDDEKKVDEPKKKKKKKKPKTDETIVKLEDGEGTPATLNDVKDGTTPAKKKKTKTGESTEKDKTVDGEDVKPDVGEKKKKKKKPKVDGETKADPAKPAETKPATPSEPPTLAAALPPAPPAAVAPKVPAPTPTLAATLGPATPASMPSSAPPIAPLQPIVRPSGPPGPTVPGQPTQPAQPGQVGQQPVQSVPGQPMPPRPPLQGVRPPPNPQTPQQSNAQYVRPPQPGQPNPQSNLPPGQGPYPPTPGQPHPSQTVRPPPLGQSMQSQGQSTPDAGSPTPVPFAPFYCTELIETDGQPGHIIVNVPIPPSGAGPRPPPGPLLGLDGEPFIGPPPLKPTQTFATIIHRSLQCLPRGRGTLGEVCNWVAGEWEWFRLNVDSGWQNSIRHNLSLNKAFLKVPRIPEDDPESKGSVWIIDPSEGPLFEEKQKRDAMKSASKDKNAESRREKERIRAEERAKKQREAAIEAARNPQPQMIQRSIPVIPRPIPRPIPNPNSTSQPTSSIPPQPPAPVSANAKGVLQPKAKIVVVMQPITPAMRTKSVISTTDANGNPLPFVCDGTTLVLDQSTFGHLTTDILDKLTLLGAAGAVDVLSAWVINKNKQQATKAAQAKTGTGTTAIAKNGTTVNNGITRPGITTTPSTTGGVVRPTQSINKPVVGTTQPVKPNTTVPSKPGVNNNGKPLPGPAPPGTSLTKVIGMIAAVANAKGDVNTVGPNASALLRYIRVVGVDIDLRVAERIWATGVVPPLPQKKVVAKPNTTAGGGTVNGVGKPAAGSTTTTNPTASNTTGNATAPNAVPKPATSTPSVTPGTGPTTVNAASSAGVKPVATASTTTSAPTTNTSAVSQPAKAASNAGTPVSKPATAQNPVSTPSVASTTQSAPTALAPASTPAATATAGMKRKLEDSGPTSSPSSAPTNVVGNSASNPIVVGGGSGMEQEAKKPRLETSGA